MRWRVLGFGLLLTACGPAVAPALPPPSTPAAGLRGVDPVAAPAPAAPSTTPANDAPSEPRFATSLEVPAPLPPSAPVPMPRVLLEPPYSALGHPRLATEMLTLGRDEELFQWALGGTSDPEHPSNRPGYHPATRVVIEAELLSRAPKGSTKRLERLARSAGYWPLRSCFEAAQRLAPKTERAARVRLTLSAAGKVLGSRSLGPTAEHEYARCVLERVRALDFSPGFTRKLDVEISVKQWPGHAPVPPRAPDNALTVRLAPDALASFESLTPTFGACYASALCTDSKLWGRIALRLELTVNGAVREAVPVETNFPNPQVVECVRQAVVGARLRSPGVSQLTFALRLGQPPPPAPSPPVPAPAAPGVEGAPAAPPAPSAPPEPVH